MKKILLSLCLVVASATVSFAGDSYFNLKLGGFFPNNSSPGLTNFRTGYNVEGAVGAKIHPNLAMEFGIGYYESEIKSSFTDTFYDLASGTTYTATPTVSVLPVTATLKGVIPVGPIELYAGGGGGYYFTWFETKVKDHSGVVVGDLNDTYTSSDFGYHVVAGVDVSISSALALGVEVKRYFVKPEYDITGRTEKIDLGGTVANAVLKLKF